MSGKQMALNGNRRVPTKRRAGRLVRRGHELGQAEYYYGMVISDFRTLFKQLGRGEFAAKADRRALVRLEAVMEEEIRPQQAAVWEEFTALFGFAWRDWVRVTNPGRATAELEPTELLFNPWEARPTAVLMGRALNRDGRPGGRIVQTHLVLGVSKVTVLSAAAGRD